MLRAILAPKRIILGKDTSKMIRKTLVLAFGIVAAGAVRADSTPGEGAPVWPYTYSDGALSATVRADARNPKIKDKGLTDGFSGGPNYATPDGAPPVTNRTAAQSSSEMPLGGKDLVVDDGARVLSASLPPGYPMDDPELSGADFEMKKEIIPTTGGDGLVVQDIVRDWIAKEGMTLREILQQWADIEGWELVWNTKREYPLKASAIFRGRFRDVSSAIVRNFSRATPQPMAKYYFGNRVLVIKTLEEHDGN